MFSHAVIPYQVLFSIQVVWRFSLYRLGKLYKNIHTEWVYTSVKYNYWST